MACSAWLRPAALLMLLLFIYPFLYGLVLSFKPHQGGWLSNYANFFTSDQLWPTIVTTMRLALPATLINLGLALPLSFRLRTKSRYQKVDHGIPGCAGHPGNRADRGRDVDVLRSAGLALPDAPILAPLQRPGAPDAQLHRSSDFAGHLRLSVRLSSDLVLRDGDRSRRSRARRPRSARIPGSSSATCTCPFLSPGLAMAFCLAFVQAFSVFPSAVLLGAPAGSRRASSRLPRMRRRSSNTTIRSPPASP